MLNIFLKLLRCNDLIGDLSQEYAVHTLESVSMKWMECPANALGPFGNTILPSESPAVLLMLHLHVLSTIRALRRKSITLLSAPPLALFVLCI